MSKLLQVFKKSKPKNQAKKVPKIAPTGNASTSNANQMNGGGPLENEMAIQPQGNLQNPMRNLAPMEMQNNDPRMDNAPITTLMNNAPAMWPEGAPMPQLGDTSGAPIQLAATNGQMMNGVGAVPVMVPQANENASHSLGQNIATEMNPLEGMTSDAMFGPVNERIDGAGIANFHFVSLNNFISIEHFIRFCFFSLSLLNKILA